MSASGYSLECCGDVFSYVVLSDADLFVKSVLTPCSCMRLRSIGFYRLALVIRCEWKKETMDSKRCKSRSVNEAVCHKFAAECYREPGRRPRVDK